MILKKKIHRLRRDEILALQREDNKQIKQIRSMYSLRTLDTADGEAVRLVAGVGSGGATAEEQAVAAGAGALLLTQVVALGTGIVRSRKTATIGVEAVASDWQKQPFT